MGSRNAARDNAWSPWFDPDELGLDPDEEEWEDDLDEDCEDEEE